MSPSTLLIDGDMIVHRSCIAVEKDTRFLDRWHILFSDFNDAWNVMEETLADLTDIAGTDDAVFVFSDDVNWRKELVDPTYKENRKGTRKPLAFHAVIEEIERKFETIKMPMLEADDALGIIQTSREDTVIWSLDKDLKQIPGLHIQDDEIVKISQKQADKFHMFQTLVGDVTDGYAGCPGVGATRAEQALVALTKVTPEPYTITRGARKGETETRWNEVPASSMWEVVVSHYQKAGLTAKDALHQARLAHILRSNDYVNGEVKLWTP